MDGATVNDCTEETTTKLKVTNEGSSQHELASKWLSEVNLDINRNPVIDSYREPSRLLVKSEENHGSEKILNQGCNRTTLESQKYYRPVHRQASSEDDFEERETVRGISDAISLEMEPCQDQKGNRLNIGSIKTPLQLPPTHPPKEVNLADSVELMKGAFRKVTVTMEDPLDDITKSDYQSQSSITPNLSGVSDTNFQREAQVGAHNVEQAGENGNEARVDRRDNCMMLLLFLLITFLGYHVLTRFYVASSEAERYLVDRGVAPGAEPLVLH